MSDSFHSKAWLLDGPVDSLPGVLSFDGSRLCFLVLAAGTFSSAKLARVFSAHGPRRTEDPTDSLPALLFDVTRGDIRACRSPWYYFGGGLMLTLPGREVRLSFLQPQNTLFPTAWNDAVHAWIGGDDHREVTVAEGRVAGKRWRQLLSA